MICTLIQILKTHKTMLYFEMSSDVCGGSTNKYLGVLNASITSGEVEEEAGH